MVLILKWVLIMPIKIYQWCISPLLPKSCKFHPTCSEYCIQALKKHGPIKGSGLGIKRLCQCHPWNNKSGIDLVP